MGGSRKVEPFLLYQKTECVPHKSGWMKLSIASISDCSDNRLRAGVRLSLVVRLSILHTC